MELRLLEHKFGEFVSRKDRFWDREKGDKDANILFSSFVGYIRRKQQIEARHMIPTAIVPIIIIVIATIVQLWVVHSNSP